MNQTVIVTGMSNREFLEAYAHPGRVGLSGGITLIDKAIARAERHIDDAGRWSLWSHSFLFQGRRPDGQHWVIESDLTYLLKRGSGRSKLEQLRVKLRRRVRARIKHLKGAVSS